MSDTFISALAYLCVGLCLFVGPRILIETRMRIFDQILFFLLLLVGWPIYLIVCVCYEFLDTDKFEEYR